MRLIRYLLVVLLCYGWGCTPQEPPRPPVPPVQEDDLAAEKWTAPLVIEPPPAVDDAPPAPSVRPPAANEKLYAYQPQEEYVVPIRIGTPADIALEPGEIVHAIVTGDRSYLAEGEAPRWEIKEGVSESEYAAIVHIFITATHPGLQQGLVITTSRRTYHLILKSVEKSPVRTVRWTYPLRPSKVVKKEPGILPDSTKPQRYQIGYVLESHVLAPDWTPLQVVDDGAKTYILFPPIILHQDAPLLRLLGPNGPEVVNVRQYSTVYIIDRRITHAELRVGVGKHAVTVTIRRGDLQRIDCPGHRDCPWWPDALRVPMAHAQPPAP